MTETALYRFYDAEDRLLYVGITSFGPMRWRDHEQHRAWWRLVVRTTVEHFDDREAAAEAERIAIQTEKPLHNTMHTGKQPDSRPRVMRGHRQGTVCQIANGRWAFAVAANGSRYNTTCQTEGEARLLMAVWEYRHANERVRRQAITMLEAGPDWKPAPTGVGRGRWSKRKAAA